MDFINSLISLSNPFAPAAILIFCIMVLMFFGLSSRKSLKYFAYIFSLISILLSGVFILLGFLKSGVFSDNLFTSGISEVIQIIIIFIFMSVLITVLFIFAKNFESFIRIAMMYQAAVISIVFIIISKNFLAFFISLISFISIIFILSSLLNSEKMIQESKETSSLKIFKNSFLQELAVTRYFSVSLLFVIFLFFSFSLLYGISDFRNFQQLMEGLSTGNFNVLFSFIIFALSFYLYFGFFPFQAPYYNYSVKCSISSVYLIWLACFPVGIISIFKFVPAAALIFQSSANSAIYIFSAVILVVMAGSAATLFKSKSLRKISSSFITLIISAVMLSLLTYICKIFSYQEFLWLNLANLSYLLISFMPVVYLFTIFERKFTTADPSYFKKIILKNRFLSFSFTIYILSIFGIPGLQGFMVKIDFIEVLINIFNGNYYNLSLPAVWILFALILIYIALAAAAAIRLLVLVFSNKSSGEAYKKDEKILSQFVPSRSIYILNGFCVALIVVVGIISLVEILFPGSFSSFFSIRSSEIFSNIVK